MPIAIKNSKIDITEEETTKELAKNTREKLAKMLADESINVVDMLNKSRENIAYTILDLEQAPSQIILDKINAVEHVINVRSL